MINLACLKRHIATGRPFALAFALALAAAVGGPGCSGPGHSIPASPGADDFAAMAAGNLRKKIGMVPIRVETAYGDRATGEMIEDLLVTAIQEECPQILLLASGTDGFPAALDSLPRTADNRIDNFELAMAGRKLGLNAVMVVSLTSISTDEKPWGFWFFKRMRHYVRGEVLIDIYDTETATKLLSRTVGKQLEIDGLDVEMIRAGNRIQNYLIEAVVEKMVDQAYEPVCETFERQEWKSYTAASSDGTLRIASGKRSGLSNGRILEVYASGSTLEGVNGHRYIMPGRKIGEVEVKTASIADALAVPLTESPIPTGSVVKIKK